MPTHIATRAIKVMHTHLGFCWAVLYTFVVNTCIYSRALTKEQMM